VISQSDKSINLVPSGICAKPGVYTVIVTYNELRLISAPKHLLKVETSIEITVEAALAERLTSLPDSLEDYVISANSSIARDRKLPSITINPIDKNSFPAKLSDGCVIACRVARRDGMQPPVLATPDKSGVVIGERLPLSICFRFPSLEVEQAVVGDDGEIVLVFSAVQASTRQPPLSGSNIELLLPLQITTNGKHAQISEELRTVSNKIEVYGQDQSVLNSKLKDLESQISAEHRLLSSKPRELTVSALNSLASTLKTELGALSNSWRKPKIPVGAAVNLGSVRSRGLIVELGFVDDENEARILSCAAQRQMKLYTVENHDDALLLKRQGISSWSFDQIASSGNDTLPPIPKNTPGNPVYLINRITFDPANEAYFRELFGRKLLFDDLKSAMEYRASETKKGKRVGEIYCRTGDTLPSGGWTNGGDRDNIRNFTLHFIFGQQPPEKRLEFQRRAKEIAIIEKLRNLISQREIALAEKRMLDEQSGEIELLKARKQELERQIPEEMRPKKKLRWRDASGAQ